MGEPASARDLAPAAISLAEHPTAAPARQQHDERNTRTQPHRSLNREVHIVLLSLVMTWRGGP
jgi:hypothetical protein